MTIGLGVLLGIILIGGLAFCGLVFLRRRMEGRSVCRSCDNHAYRYPRWLRFLVV